MTVKELCNLLNSLSVLDDNTIINMIQLDSKKIKEGDVFLAIGKGHDYIKEAFENGASAVITEKPYPGNVIQVQSTLNALGILGTYYREKYNIPLIAVTGSVGKTTTKEFISEILKTQYNVLKSEKNHNNHIGLPATLLKLNSKIDVAVVELGMNHLREISYLSHICKPDYAVITNIGTAHIGNLGSRKNIYKAKMEILDGMEKGYLIVNKEDKYLKNAKFPNGKVIYCDIHKLPIKNIRYYTDRTEFDWIADQKYHFILPIPGKAILKDCLLSIQIGLLFNISISNIQKAVSSFTTKEGRICTYDGKYKIIDDTYNSSYESVKESLLLLKKEKGNKIIVLGDMLEFGKFSKKYHKKINRYLRHIHHKQVLLVGEYTKYIKGKRFSNLNSLWVYLENHIQEDDVIFLKGSRCLQLNLLVEKLLKYN